MPVPVQLVRDSLASCHFCTLHTTAILADAVAGRESEPHREMTLGPDVPFGRRRRERLFDINNPAGWGGFKGPGQQPASAVRFGTV